MNRIHELNAKREILEHLHWHDEDQIPREFWIAGLDPTNYHGYS